MKEMWRPIPGYEGIYWASNFGNIRSVKCVLKPSKHRDGYLHVVLCVKGVRKTYQVHRLVALAFIPNPKKFPQINHKDEDKTNNCVENLEWCTMDYNIHYGTGQKRCRNRGLPSNTKAVVQLSLDGDYINEYPSTIEAQRKTGIKMQNIRSCALGVYSQSGGYKWKYK
jgi:hypothetical protein